MMKTRFDKMALCIAGLAVVLCVNREVIAQFNFPIVSNLGEPVNSTDNDNGPSISIDDLSLYFHSNREGGLGSNDIWVSDRNAPSDLWGEPVNLGPFVNSSEHEAGPSISSDELSLYFYREDEDFDSLGVFVATRPSTSEQFGEPVLLIADGVGPSISSNGLELFFTSFSELSVARRENVSDPFGDPISLGIRGVSGPDISADGLALFYTDNSGFDITVITRPTINDPFGEPFELPEPVNGRAISSSPSISADGSTLYFTSTRGGGVGGFRDIWQAVIPEPSTFVLAVLGLMGLVAWRQRKW